MTTIRRAELPYRGEGQIIIGVQGALKLALGEPGTVAVLAAQHVALMNDAGDDIRVRSRRAREPFQPEGDIRVMVEGRYCEQPDVLTKIDGVPLTTVIVPPRAPKVLVTEVGRGRDDSPLVYVEVEALSTIGDFRICTP